MTASARRRRTAAPPRRFSPAVEAQLRRLEQLNDREALELLWRAIREAEGRRP